MSEGPQWDRASMSTEAGMRQELLDIEQILGKALGYPWYKDDPKNFPGADESVGVCTGEHTPGSIAMEAAAKIKELQSGRIYDDLRNVIIERNRLQGQVRLLKNTRVDIRIVIAMFLIIALFAFIAGMLAGRDLEQQRSGVSTQSAARAM